MVDAVIVGILIIGLNVGQGLDVMMSDIYIQLTYLGLTSASLTPLPVGPGNPLGPFIPFGPGGPTGPGAPAVTVYSFNAVANPRIRSSIVATFAINRLTVLQFGTQVCWPPTLEMEGGGLLAPRATARHVALSTGERANPSLQAHW